MKQPSEALKALLFDLRQNAAFPELLELLKPEPIARFVPRKTEDIAVAHSKWTYQSGQHRHYEVAYSLFTGTNPPRGDE